MTEWCTGEVNPVGIGRDEPSLAMLPGVEGSGRMCKRNADTAWIRRVSDERKREIRIPDRK